MALHALRGTTDLLGDDARRWTALEHAVRCCARLHGYEELRTPIIEEAGLFLRSLGEQTDLIQKEMFRVSRGGSQAADRADPEAEARGPGRSGQEIVLRPEGTAPVVRAYLERNLHKTQGFAKLFYLGPMFRAERPQAGRFRQFHQVGAEALGSASPWVDVEVILLCVRLLEACGVAASAVWLASMGCRPDQQRSAEALRARLAPQRDRLCAECQQRFEKNIFRVLDCKHAACHAIAWAGLRSPFLLCEACATHFDAVRDGLRRQGIAFDDSKTFARGLDYYTRTVFEVRVEGLGAQDAVAAGGRYDHLVEELGGPAVGAVGFAAGIERILLAGKPPASPATARRAVFVATPDPGLLGEVFRVVSALRDRGVPTLCDFDGRSLKAQLREADRARCRFVAILGEAERQQQTLTVKDLDQQSQTSMTLDQLAEQARTPSCHAADPSGPR